MELLRKSLLLLALAPLGACLAPIPAAAGEDNAVATVAGQAIYEKDLDALLQSQLRQLRSQEYELKIRLLDGLINQKLVEAEARRRGTTSERLLAEIDSTIPDPTDGEVEAFYLGQKDRINRPLTEVKEQLRQNLKQARIQEARQAYFKALRSKGEVAVLLQPPRIEVGYDPARVRGRADAPVTIVEFSDFQCPFCQRVEPTLKAILAKYDGRVKLAYRDFPLREIHPRAESAAEAARCAGEQGKFWEYHDLLLSQPGNLDAAALANHAKTLGLDGRQFDSCLASGKFRALVEKDLEDGKRAGVSGTPGFLVNGVALNGAQPAAAFEKIIDAALEASTPLAAGR